METTFGGCPTCGEGKIILTFGKNSKSYTFYNFSFLGGVGADGGPEPEVTTLSSAAPLFTKIYRYLDTEAFAT